MELKQYKSGDEVKILDLFHKAFGKELSPEFWKWRFAANPFLEPHLINLMWEGDVMAGHYAVSASEIIMDGETYLTSLSGTTMTHPDFAGKGIFTDLALTLYDRVAQDYGVNMVLGFPNKNSHYGLVKKIEWKDVAILPTLSINAGKLKNTANDNVRQIETFTEAHSSFAKNSIEKLGFSIYTNRSAKYLNWRYLDCPINDYHCFEYTEDGAIQGIIITKRFASFSTPGEFEIDIVEVFSNANIGVLDALMTAVNYFYNSIEAPFNKMNMWMSVLDARHLLLEKLGFSIGLPLTFMCTKAFKPGFEAIYNYQNWYISMGDSDVY
jgi:hypothetical protein